MATSTYAASVGAATSIGGLAAGLYGKGTEDARTSEDDQNKSENNQTDNDDQGKQENDQTDKNAKDDQINNENDEIYIGTTERKIRLGNHSDFEITNNVIKEHKMVKKQVLQDLLELSDEAENLVIEKIDKEMTSTGVAMAGRGIWWRSLVRGKYRQVASHFSGQRHLLVINSNKYFRRKNKSRHGKSSCSWLKLSTKNLKVKTYRNIAQKVKPLPMKVYLISHRI